MISQQRFTRIELPWAVAKRQGFEGKAPGLYYWYFRTRGEAEAAIKWCEKEERWHGPIERRPGECHQL